MGTDINGAIAHRLRFPPARTLASEMSEGIERISPFLRNEWKWKAEYDKEPRFRTLDNCGGPTVWLGHRAALISTGVGWDQAAHDPELREEIVSAVSAIGRFFKSPRVVLLPCDVEPWCNIQDSIMYDGSTLDELLKSLARIHGPVPDFISAIGAENAEPDYLVNGYLILEL
jgi:hypothetical protein